MNLTFIINGENTIVDAFPDMSLSFSMDTALHLSNNTSRALSDWEARDVTGVLLETHRTTKELGLQEGARIFLSVRVGAGGSLNPFDSKHIVLSGRPYVEGEEKELWPTHDYIPVTFKSESGHGPFGAWAVGGGGAVEVSTEQFHQHVMNELTNHKE